MILKVLIVVLFFATVASLFSGAVFFFKDQGTTKRTFYALGVRITFASLLLITIVYGIMTGQLGLNAPWHQSMHPDTATSTSKQ